jgi:hypothetical protein
VIFDRLSLNSNESMLKKSEMLVCDDGVWFVSLKFQVLNGRFYRP